MTFATWFKRIYPPNTVDATLFNKLTDAWQAGFEEGLKKSMKEEAQILRKYGHPKDDPAHTNSKTAISDERYIIASLKGQVTALEFINETQSDQMVRMHRRIRSLMSENSTLDGVTHKKIAKEYGWTSQ